MKLCCKNNSKLRNPQQKLQHCFICIVILATSQQQNRFVNLTRFKSISFEMDVMVA